MDLIDVAIENLAFHLGLAVLLVGLFLLLFLTSKISDFHSAIQERTKNWPIIIFLENTQTKFFNLLP